MNRRDFLTRALTSVPVVLAGAELAELLAPRKAIFLPPRGGWTPVRSLQIGDIVSTADGRRYLVVGDSHRCGHAICY